MRGIRTVALGVGLVAGGAVLAACSTGPGQSTSTTVTTAPSTTSTTAATTTTTVAPTTTTAATTKCKLSGLSVAHTGTSGAAGTEENTFSLTNKGQAPCTLYGYPGLALLGPGTAAVQTTVVRGGGTTLTDMAPETVTLAPGAVAYFNVTSSDVTTAGTTCSHGSSVEVTPPTNTTSATLAVNFDACDNGRLDVSPVFSSTDTADTQTTAPA